MDKPVPVQSHPAAGYQMNTMGPPPGQPMMPQQTGYEQPPSYQQPPQQGIPLYPVAGHQPPVQSPIQQGAPPVQSPIQQGAPPVQSPVQQGAPPAQPYAYPDGTYGMPLTALGSTSAPVLCPNCGHRGMTNVEYESGGFTHLVALAVCCFICLGCFAYMANSLKDCHHRCSKCNVPLATYHRSGRTELHFRPQ